MKLNDIDETIIMKMKAEKELKRMNDIINKCLYTKSLVKADPNLSAYEKMKMLSDLDLQMSRARLAKINYTSAIANFNEYIQANQKEYEESDEFSVAQFTLANDRFDKNHGA